MENGGRRNYNHVFYILLGIGSKHVQQRAHISVYPTHIGRILDIRNRWAALGLCTALYKV